MYLFIYSVLVYVHMHIIFKLCEHFVVSSIVMINIILLITCYIIIHFIKTIQIQEVNKTGNKQNYLCSYLSKQNLAHQRRIEVC